MDAQKKSDESAVSPDSAWIEPVDSDSVGMDSFSFQEKLSMTFEERTFDELRKDPGFLRLRNMLLLILVFGGGALFGGAWFMFAKVINLIDFVAIIAAFVASTVLVTKRLNAKKAAVVEKLKRDDAESIRRAEYEAALAEYHRQNAERANQQEESSSEADILKDKNTETKND